MKVRIKKWGNSASVRIPAAILASGVFRLDQIVEVKESGGKIVIEPVAEPYDLETLIADMDPETFPEDVGFGPPAGREVW